MNNQHLVIRAFNGATDTATLSRIWLEASLVAHPFIGEATLREQQLLIEKHYLPEAETWVACFSNEPLGFISLIGNFVGGIFVAPAKQGLGIGRQLIAHAMTRHATLSLEVYTANRAAMTFYAALGFDEVSRRPDDDQGMPFENAQLVLRG